MSKRNRRDFNKAVLAAAAASLAVSSAHADDEPKDLLSVTSQATFEIVRARYGKHLSEEQLKRLRQKVRTEQVNAERLRRVRLSNGDEPGFLFQADVL